MTDTARLEDRKTRARAWFESLRDQIIAAFESLEDEAPADLYPARRGDSSAGRGSARRAAAA